jgi:hypothetical protein
MSMPPIAIYSYNAIPMKISMIIFPELEKKPNIHMETQ